MTARGRQRGWKVAVHLMLLPFLLAANSMRVLPGECLVVEDSERGLVSATRAGMRCVVVPRGLSRTGDFAAALRVLELARLDRVFRIFATLEEALDADG